MLSAGRVDDLALTLVMLALAVAAGVLVRLRPRLGMIAYVAVLGLVPSWFGISFLVPIAPVTAVSLVLLAALWRGARVRPVFFDLVMALVLGLIVVSCAAGYVTFQRTYAVLAAWGVPYLLARVLSRRVEARWIYTCIAVVMTLVAGLAILEFVTEVNLFTRFLRASNALYARWSNIQVRGGIRRAEGAFGHSIALGGTLAMAVPFVWASRLRPRAKAACLAVVVGGAFLTFSRIGMGTAVLAVVLCVVFVTQPVTRRFRVGTLVLVAAGVAAALPSVADVFSAAGDEAAGSASYRGDLLSLLPSMSVLGESPVAARSAAGEQSFGEFESIDSAFLLVGLTFGSLPLVVLTLSGIAGAVALLRGARVAPLVSVLAILPALTSVAFITQFTVFFWFAVGLAATHAARGAGPPVDAAREPGLHVFHPDPPRVPVQVDGSIPEVEGGRNAVA